MGVQERGAKPQAAGGQVLTFRLGTESYGVDILRVKEIRGWSAVTRIPRAPAHVLGVLNLRGAIVPIIDLRLRFALESAQFLPTTVVIVLSLHGAEGTRECGIVVDSVSDVMDLAPESIRPAPDMAGNTDGHFISGLANAGEGIVILLDVDELVARDLRPVATGAAA